jgi:hypothetical protein
MIAPGHSGEFVPSSTKGTLVGLLGQREGIFSSHWIDRNLSYTFTQQVVGNFDFEACVWNHTVASGKS